MPNLATLLKEEISKIVRKEVQDQVRELQKTVREQRDALARLEKQSGPAKAKAAAKPAAAKPTAAKPTDCCRTGRQSPQSTRRHRR